MTAPSGSVETLGFPYVEGRKCAQQATLKWIWYDSTVDTAQVLLVGNDVHVVSKHFGTASVPITRGRTAHVLSPDLAMFPIEMPTTMDGCAEVFTTGNLPVPTFEDLEPEWLTAALVIVLSLTAYGISKGYMNEYPRATALSMIAIMAFHLPLVWHIGPGGYLLAVVVAIGVMVSRALFWIGVQTYQYGWPSKWISWPSKKQREQFSMCILFMILFLMSSFMLARTV